MRAFLDSKTDCGNLVLFPVSHLFWSLLCRPGEAGEGIPVSNVGSAPLEKLSLRQIHAAPGARTVAMRDAVKSRTSIKCFRLLLDSAAEANWSSIRLLVLKKRVLI
jgi:hypothetical protein